MDINYLSDNIFIENGESFFINRNKKKRITAYNWHKILNEIGWNKLNVNWIKILNKLSDKVMKNSQYGELDCGSNGNCFFNCIAYSMNTNTNYKDIYTPDKLRELIANSINKKKFKEMIEIYKILYDNDDFFESWNPYTINLNEFKTNIKSDSFWGDDILINELIILLNLNIIILSTDTVNNKFILYNTLNKYDLNKNSIILNYIDHEHFTLIGHFENNVMKCFFEKIPCEIQRILDM